MTMLEALHNYAYSKGLTDEEGIADLISYAPDLVKDSPLIDVVKAYAVLKFLKSNHLYDGNIELFDASDLWLYLIFDKTPTLKFTVDRNTWIILNESYLPCAIKTTANLSTDNSIISKKNWELFIRFASSRVLAMDYEHANDIFEYWGYNLNAIRLQTSADIICNGSIIDDKYWICTNPDKLTKPIFISLFNQSVS